MRIALLAHFPLHVVPGQNTLAPSHYATWLPQLSARFAEAGHEFHWLTMSRQPVPDEPLAWRGQTFHFLQNPARLRMLRGYRRDVHLLHARLNQLQPDLVHAWGTEDCYGLAGALSGRPWLLSMQGILGEYIRRSRMHPFVWLQAAYEKFTLRRARRITVESRWGQRILGRMAPHAQIDRVEYGVQEAFYTKAWEPDPARPHVIFIGTIDERKGVQDAVRAFAAPELRDRELHIVGDLETPLARRLRPAATPNVRWLGRLSSDETAEALRHAWGLILPTRADTSPNVVKEARVVGLPVVTTPHGGQSDYIFDGENGFLCEPGDTAAWTGAAVRLLADLGDAQALGANRWEEQREHFQSAHTAEGFLALYEKLRRAS